MGRFITTLLLVVTLFLNNYVTPSSSLTNDGPALLALKAAITADPTHTLASWRDTDSTPCHWHGVTCVDQRVISLSLPSKNLTGYIPSELGLLDSLSRLSLSHNNFSKPIPSHLFSATSLRFLDLSHNSLSGQIPVNVESLQQLTHLDLSSNCLNGSLPESLVALKSLTGTLNLSFNDFSGEIPESYGQFPVLVSLDLRHNKLTGKVPLIGSLVNQGPTAFAGNPGLCGFPLQTPCPEAVNVNVTTSNENPEDFNSGSLPRNGAKAEKKIGSVAVPLISGVVLVIVAATLSVWIFRRKRKGGGKGKTGEEVKEGGEINDAVVNGEGQKGKFVVMEEAFNLELEDLLRASAYVVGKSRSGIMYKVVVGGVGSGSHTMVPTVVAVRRLSESDNTTWKLKEFESEVEAIGRVHHPNIVRLKAYYFAHDEKLLISDFYRNGSLHSALHDGASNTLSPLSWATRLKIAQGTARGLMNIHDCSPRKYVHGNLKSTKILLDDELQACISGFGLSRLISGASKFTAAAASASSSSASKKQYLNQTMVSNSMGLRVLPPSNTYLAPEARISATKFTQKCDVYSFGIILMELLTGRLPDAVPENDDKGLENLVRKVFREERPLSEIIDPALLKEGHAKKQVVAVFHIALNCTELDPELRPRMRTVSENLDNITLR